MKLISVSYTHLDVYKRQVLTWKSTCDDLYFTKTTPINLSLCIFSYWLNTNEKNQKNVNNHKFFTCPTPISFKQRSQRICNNMVERLRKTNWMYKSKGMVNLSRKEMLCGFHMHYCWDLPSIGTLVYVVT